FPTKWRKGRGEVLIGKSKKYWAGKMAETARGKVCMITGATGAIGQATAMGLARSDTRIILACRSHERGEQLKAAIIAATGNSAVEVMLVDLASQQSIRAMVAAFIAK